MKKIVCVILAVMLLSGCEIRPEDTVYKGKTAGIWLSCYELDEFFSDKKSLSAKLDTMIKNCKELNINRIYIHTRAFGETIYPSQYFPLVESLKGYAYDVFEYIINKCRKEGLFVYAWINPYRLVSSGGTDTLNREGLPYKWLTDDKKDNDYNIAFCEGVYFNPASDVVKKLIINEVRELINKYNVDGIHFDDYFYPTDSPDFDAALYEEYVAGASVALPQEDWRRENVNMLIEAVGIITRTAQRKVDFSISPAASLTHNYQKLYADIEKWVSEGWLDEIIPQLYFGFEYPDDEFKFENLLSRWKEITRSSGVSLKVGLACYKAVPTLEADKAEWENKSDIIARQISICDNDNAVDGYVYFSYSSLFGERLPYKNQRLKIKEYLKVGEVYG